MIGLVYVCNGKIKGFTLPIKVDATLKDEATFVKNMVEEGAKQEGNIIPTDGSYVNWSCIVFNADGKPIWHYEHDNVEGKLFKVNVEQKETA